MRFRFHRARFTRDVPVNGTATWSLRTGAVRARLTVPGRVRWNLRYQLAVATLGGRLDGRRLRATMLAP